LRELLLRAHNYCTSEFPSGVYATAILLLIDGSRLAIDAVIAGHPPLIYQHADGSVEKVGGEIAPLGLFGEPPEDLGPIKLSLAPGERLIAYSDGIVETRNAAGEMYTDSRLTRAIATAAQEPLADMVNHVLEDVATWRGPDKPAEDDITILALQFEAAERPA
jgi:serine phosphatase RsbU (regulator of sigma subunit)